MGAWGPWERCKVGQAMLTVPSMGESVALSVWKDRRPGPSWRRALAEQSRNMFRRFGHVFRFHSIANNGENHVFLSARRCRSWTWDQFQPTVLSTG